MMIYLDYSATTPVAPEVLDAMLPYFNTHFGNASSRLHLAGWQAEEAVNEARSTIAQQLNCSPEEIFFTSGATEGINLLFRGYLDPNGNKVLTLKTEHKAVLDTCEFLKTKYKEIEFIKTDEHGVIDLTDLESKLNFHISFVTVMAVNNETGVVQPIEAIAQLCEKAAVPFFCDATQAVGKIPIDVQQWRADALVFSAHKFYGPKGIGAIYLNREAQNFFRAEITGGGQEQNLRSGTLNVPGIVGMAEAMKWVYTDWEQENNRIQTLKQLLWEELQTINDLNIISNSTAPTCVPHILNLQFGDLDSETWMNAFNHELCVSNGSACNSATVAPSHVLLAMGKTVTEAKASLRFSLGRYTTIEEIKKVKSILFPDTQ